MSNIKHYKEEDLEPISNLTWHQVETFLKAAYDPRFCSSTAEADDNIEKGVTGDALAAYESFPHLIWAMVKKGDISVTDSFPRANPPVQPGRDVHGNLDYALGEYAKDRSPNAWKMVEAVFSRNGFTDAVKAKVAKAVYDALFKFIDIIAPMLQESALVIVKADPRMSFYDPELYGGFGKRGKGRLESSAFSRQVWTGHFKGDGDLNTKTKRAIHAIIFMASKA
ncbi:uncharacterized protein BDW43DRAFT_312814 [Aspergillus alliaceus]|uniref:uncharacterized protein n=1 Tax=Petromyces alliaceus TaxID=209559 RepID=UPI0012A4E8A9|nr:uncharacterized protein BDW43DRAFT_312814 [Aspergillus alliaceus]KAB8231589.1 hypothetical protein BDW43DRAFT_312814 [Aspergillus alliaceus]